MEKNLSKYASMKKIRLHVLCIVGIAIMISCYLLWWFISTDTIIIRDSSRVIVEQENLGNHPLFSEYVQASAFTLSANLRIIHAVESTEVFNEFYVLLDCSLQHLEIINTGPYLYRIIFLNVIPLTPDGRRVPPTRPVIFGDVHATTIIEITTSRRTGEIIRITERTEYFAINVHIRIMNQDGTCNNYCNLE